MSNSAITSKAKSSVVAVSDDTLSGLQFATNEAIEAYSRASGTKENNMIAAVKSAKAIQSLRLYFDDPGIKSAVVALQDSPLGFRTDKDPTVKRKNKDGSYTFNNPYDYEVVKEAVIEALLRGLQLVGNQFNIIAGRFYCTKEGFEALIREAPIADFRLNIGVPKTTQGGVVVECSATWNQNGKTCDCNALIPVKADQYSTADQLTGKATRKLLARCYQQMTGRVISDGDSSEPQAQPIAGTTPPLTPLMAQVMDPAATYQQAQAASLGATHEPASLSDEQYSQLRNAMAKQLSALGACAFEADVCACFDVESLSELPAERFKAVINGLVNPTSVDRWNQGCASGSGEQILSDEEISDLQPAQAESSDDDEIQGALV